MPSRRTQQSASEAALRGEPRKRETDLLGGPVPRAAQTVRRGQRVACANRRRRRRQRQCCFRVRGAVIQRRRRRRRRQFVDRTQNDVPQATSGSADPRTTRWWRRRSTRDSRRRTETRRRRPRTRSVSSRTHCQLSVAMRESTAAMRNAPSTHKSARTRKHAMWAPSATHWYSCRASRR